jgi:hypothetical protein
MTPVMACLALLAAPATAQERGARVSIGYAFLQYLEEGGGSAPVGAYLSVASAGRTVGIEADVAYHRDSETNFEQTIVLHTVIAGIGPRFELGSANAVPFLHLLGGVRYDSIEGESNTAFGGMSGLGVDIPAGPVFVRLGADFQIFFDAGENFKTLRLAAGLSF